MMKTKRGLAILKLPDQGLKLFLMMPTTRSYIYIFMLLKGASVKKKVEETTRLFSPFVNNTPFESEALRAVYAMLTFLLQNMNLQNGTNI